MIGIDQLIVALGAADTANKATVALRKNPHVVGHGGDVATLPDGHRHIAFEDPGEIVADQRRDLLALFILVVMVQGDKRALDAEMGDKLLLNLGAEDRVVFHADLDNSFVASFFQQPTDLNA